MDFNVTRIQFLSESDIVQISNDFEENRLKSIMLKSDILAFQKEVLNLDLIPSLNSGNGFSESSKFSTFGNATFPFKNNRSRDVTKWSPILGRKYKGICDDLPVSSFCNMLVSFGIKESLSSTEFFKFVLNNIEADLTVRIVNHLISKDCIDDSCESRLTELYAYLRTTYGITDTPCLLQSKLEKLRQENLSITEFSQLFSKRLDEVQALNPKIPSARPMFCQDMSRFKSCLHERYRVYAGDQYDVNDYDKLVSCLMIWEKNIESREGRLPNSKPLRE